MIVIVDYHCGNVGSVKNMIRKIGYQAVIASDADTISRAEKIILPGVGAFDTGMKHLNDLKLIETLNRKALHEQVPVLGICLGMQLMTRKSEEGLLPGLAWIDGEVKKFSAEKLQLKVPHMGWNFVKIVRSSPMAENLFEFNKFYFVHSFYVTLQNPEDIVFESEYGITFTSGFERKNLWGVQFHPEKSHKYGMRVLSNFLNF